MPTPCFYLSVHIVGYEAEVFVNGAPILRTSRRFAAIAAPPVSEWMVQGENVLSVVVHGGTPLDPHVAEAERRARAEAGEEAADGGEGDGGEADDGAAPPQLRVALCQGILGDLVDPGEDRELAVVEWTPPPVPAEDEPLLPLPHEERAAADVSPPWGPWAWERAARFDFETEPEAVMEIADFLRALVDAVGRGDLDALIDASPLSYDEVAPCYDFDPADARARLPNAWGEITRPAGWRLAPFDESDLDLRLCCDGRVVEPRTLGGAPILRQDEELEGILWAMPIFVAKIDGELTIVR